MYEFYLNEPTKVTFVSCGSGDDTFQRILNSNMREMSHCEANDDSNIVRIALFSAVIGREYIFKFGYASTV